MMEVGPCRVTSLSLIVVTMLPLLSVTFTLPKSPVCLSNITYVTILETMTILSRNHLIWPCAIKSGPYYNMARHLAMRLSGVSVPCSK